MFLTSISSLLVAVGVSSLPPGPFTGHVFNMTFSPRCPPFGEIENGRVTVDNGYQQFATVHCNSGYDLYGAPNVYCLDGDWEVFPRECHKRCPSPPSLYNGSVEIEGNKDENGLFHKGTLATYNCSAKYELSPKESQYRVCEKGIWTGAEATCVPIKATSCPSPRDINNGYFVPERGGEDVYNVGQRLHYSCKNGFLLLGPPVQQCLDDGTWSPKIGPICAVHITEDSSGGMCPPAPKIPRSATTVVQGYQSDLGATHGTKVQIHCLGKYRNSRDPCQPGKLRCIDGNWVGITPICVVAHECESPPAVPYAAIYNFNQPSYETSLTNKYPLKAQISYQCLPGYTLQGNEIFTCASGGCWSPMASPSCNPPSNNYFLEVNSVNAVLISAATGAGVLGLLLVICLITVCRRRKPLSRSVPIAPPVQRADLGDHASLLHHPDRLALIAFADGLQNDQAALPTYDEATRDRAPSLASTRLHRPHWPNLGVRRSRNGPNTDMVHVARHGSFASHTPSTRSAGDSMGSTDTMAVSEGSTNVTLDTASSHSGSQPASCRVHCGSLASFDTSSVVNTEGVPLLEESELEEIHGGDNVSLVLGNPSISDNASFKLSTHSADLP